MTRVPAWVKIAYTLWMLVWVPLYWIENGPVNFLWLCDFANLVVLAALWLESPLLATSQLAGVTIIQAVWAVDYFGALLTGVHPIGGTEYMFDAGDPAWLRALSLFHVWTVPFLIWLVRRVGYDRRGWKLQTALAAMLLPLGQMAGTKAQNLNWMWRPFGVEQTVLPPLLFALLSVPVVAVVLFLPGDRFARRVARSRSS